MKTLKFKISQFHCKNDSSEFLLQIKHTFFINIISQFSQYRPSISGLGYLRIRHVLELKKLNFNYGNKSKVNPSVTSRIGILFYSWPPGPKKRAQFIFHVHQLFGITKFWPPKKALRRYSDREMIFLLLFFNIFYCQRVLTWPKCKSGFPQGKKSGIIEPSKVYLILFIIIIM